MTNNTISAIINLGNYSCVNDDLFNSIIVDKKGNQLFLQTLDKYIELLKEATSALEAIRDSTDDSEEGDVELIASKNVLRVIGNSDIIERYVICGMAEYDDVELESGSDTDTYENVASGSTEPESDSESDADYNEYLVGSDDDENSSTPVDFSDSEELNIANLGLDNDLNSIGNNMSELQHMQHMAHHIARQEELFKMAQYTSQNQQNKQDHTYNGYQHFAQSSSDSDEVLVKKQRNVNTKK